MHLINEYLAVGNAEDAARPAKIVTVVLNVAAEKHHGYYDGIISTVDDSVEVIDRLSNGPLGQDGEH